MTLVKRNLVIKNTNTHPAFTCPKSTTETPEQGASHAQSLKKRHQHNTNDAVLVFSMPTPNTPTHCPSASIANPEHAIVRWVFTVKTNIIKLSSFSKH